MRLAIHFDCSCIYRQYRNNFDQKLQNKSEKLIKTFVSASHISDEFVWVPSYVCRKVFSSGSYRENLAFFPPEIYFWIPVPLRQSQNELFFSVFDGSNWFQLRASIDRPLNPSWICWKTSLFFSSVTEIRAIVTSTHVHIWKSLCTKKIYYINKFLRFSGNRHLGGEGKKVRYLEKKVDFKETTRVDELRQTLLSKLLS